MNRVKEVKAVIQAGGKGSRLQPYTLVLPKPLMPVRGIPVIEMLLKWLRQNGIRDVYITIGYLGHLIKTLCGDGSQWDLKITYSEEPTPLGTVGPLKLIKGQLDGTFIMLNGDLITDLDLQKFISFHRKHKGLLTVASTKKNVKVDLGVMEIRGGKVTKFSEKPTLEYTVSMGIYCLEPSIVEIIPAGVPFGFDHLMYEMLKRKLSVWIYEHEGIWMDIGREEDYIEAQRVLELNGE